MKAHLLAKTLVLSAIALISVTLAYSQSSGKIRRAPDGHPDLSGTWAFGIDLPPTGVTKVVDGQVIRSRVDQSARHAINNDVPGALPWTKAPSYKPEFQEKVKHLEANESKLDGYFYCGKLHVIERLWLTPDNNLVYQVTVDDPGVLTGPWTNFPHLIKPSTELLEESPPCKDDDGSRLLNLDHHLQR